MQVVPFVELQFKHFLSSIQMKMTLCYTYTGNHFISDQGDMSLQVKVVGSFKIKVIFHYRSRSLLNSRSRLLLISDQGDITGQDFQFIQDLGEGSLQIKMCH